jgi:hypothetical protein
MKLSEQVTMFISGTVLQYGRPTPHPEFPNWSFCCELSFHQLAHVRPPPADTSNLSDFPLTPGNSSLFHTHAFFSAAFEVSDHRFAATSLQRKLQWISPS